MPECRRCRAMPCPESDRLLSVIQRQSGRGKAGHAEAQCPPITTLVRYSILVFTPIMIHGGPVPAPRLTRACLATFRSFQSRRAMAKRMGNSNHRTCCLLIALQTSIIQCLCVCVDLALYQSAWFQIIAAKALRRCLVQKNTKCQLF
jgi:hypothetical protein